MELNEYEQQREEAVKRNQAMLAQLKVKSTVLGLAALKEEDPSEKRKKRRAERQRLEPSSAQPARQSSRATAVATKARLTQQAAALEGSDDGGTDTPGASEDESADVDNDTSGEDDTSGASSAAEDDSDGQSSEERDPPQKGKRAQGGSSVLQRSANRKRSSHSAGRSIADEPRPLYDDNVLQLLGIDLGVMGIDPADCDMVEAIVRSCAEANGIDLEELQPRGDPLPGSSPKRSKGGKRSRFFAPADSGGATPADSGGASGEEGRGGQGQNNAGASSREPARGRKPKRTQTSKGTAAKCATSNPGGSPKGDDQEGGLGDSGGNPTGGNPRSVRQGKKPRKRGPVFETPTPEEVDQAFRLLDPRGAGFVGKAGLAHVFKTLQGRELSDHELDLMMWLAQNQADSQEGRIERSAFDTLVNTFL